MLNTARYVEYTHSGYKRALQCQTTHFPVLPVLIFLLVDTAFSPTMWGGGGCCPPSSHPPTLSLPWEGMTERRAEQVAFLRASQIPLPATRSPPRQPPTSPHTGTWFRINGETDKIFTNLHSPTTGEEGRFGSGGGSSMRRDSKLVPRRDTCGGVARQVPSFPLYFLLLSSLLELFSGSH